MDRPTAGTEDRILDGALRALARYGPNEFSMASICRESGVSRRTLYRYFHNRDEVLQAVARHVGDTYDKAVAEAIENRPELDDRVEVVLWATVHYGEYHPAAAVVRRLEPGFTIEFLEGTLAHYVDVVRRALEPASARILAIHSGSVKLEELAEVVVRLGISAFFMQSERAGELPDIFARVLKDSTRPHRATTRRAIASG